MKKWLLGLCLLFGLATLSVCSFSDGLLIGKTQRKIQDTASPDKDWVEVPEDSYKIGTLGGRKVRMSSYQVQDVSYTDTPTAFSKDWKTYKAPPRTYDSVLFGFGFYLNYETGVIRDIRHDEGFYDELKVSGTPWVLVGVHSNLEPLDKNPENINRRLKWNLEGNNTVLRRYVRYSESPYGLDEQYRILEGTDPATGKSYREDADDIFVSRGKDGNIHSYIECSARIFAPYSDIKLPNPPCSHTFALRAKGIDVTFRLGYSRHRLYDWHKIEEQAIKTILAFAEAADKDIAANAHHKQQEAKNEAVDAARY